MAQDLSASGTLAASLSGLAVSTPPTPLTASEQASAAHASTRSRFGAESAMGLLVENLKDRILFAVPKKGRLNEKCLELLAGE